MSAFLFGFDSLCHILHGMNIYIIVISLIIVAIVGVVVYKTFFFLPPTPKRIVYLVSMVVKYMNWHKELNNTDS
jgi:hypothetical protein